MTTGNVRGVVWLLGTASLLHAEPARPVPAAPPPAAERRAEPSPAERIAKTRDSLRSGRQALEKIQKKLDAPDGEYQKAQAEFEALGQKLQQARQAIAKLKKDGKPGEAAPLEAALPPLQEDWQAAKERFDLAIRQRKLSQEALVVIKTRLANDQALLDRLEGKATPAGPSPTAAGAPPTSSSSPVGDPAGPAAGLPGPSSVPGPVTPAVVPHLTTAGRGDGSPEDNDPTVQKARDEVDARRAELHDAEAQARTAEARLRDTERSLRTVGQVLQVEQEATAQTEKTVTRLADTLRARPQADPAERQALKDRLADAEGRLAQGRERGQRLADRIELLKETLRDQQEEQARAAQEVGEKRRAADAAAKELASLLSPLGGRNLLRWVTRHGPNLLAILSGMFILHLGARRFSRHIVRLIARGGQRGSEEDRENRASTLVGVFRYAAGVAIFGGGLVMLLDEAGVPVVPLLGGAAVLGLAVAFGSQNLVRDYFTGFLMLLEDQYSVNDVVRIGTVSGVVEEITLRVTVLRDIEGVRHFLPHGAVTAVSNLTHGWSRALLDIPVGYQEDIDRVIAVLRDLGRELRADPELGVHILEDPETLGVEALGDSGVVVRFFLKTRPLKQWPVKREMLRRIKNRFDQLGIEIPFPHRTVHHRFAGGAAGALPLAADPGRLAG